VIPEGHLKIKWAAMVEGVFFVAYDCEPERLTVYSPSGELLGTFDLPGDGTGRLVGAARDATSAWYSFESFTDPPRLVRRDVKTGEDFVWWRREIPGGLPRFAWKRVSYRSKDACEIPMYLAGRPDVLESTSPVPTIITGYGGGGVPMRPEFGVLTSIMMERGCLFALPNVRGGGEFGPAWHEAARRRKRQTAIDDYVAAVEYLIAAGHSRPPRIASFGGCNGGLLVGAAAMQRPDLFRAVLCIAPLLDMLRYHRFQRAIQWVNEYGTSEDADDFAALQRYSPYNRVVDGTHYPAFMMITGDSDDRVDPMHARKMTARLQEATTSGLPVILDYSPHRGHKPVLPLGERVEALTARLAFLCEHLGV
jgi:prolyl oligopeptidase